MSLQEIWRELDGAQSVKRDGILRRRIFPDSRCDLFVGTQFPSHRRLFLVRVSNEAADRISQLPRARGCEVGKIHLPEDPPDKVSFWLSLTDTRYSDVFTSLVEDVAASLSKVEQESTLVETFVARLKQWQNFLDHRSPEGLGEESQRGLFGELYFLQHYLLPILKERRSVDSWKGPTSAIHDFELPAVSIEVKTTISKQHEKLYIASERQLDTSNLKRLVLVHFALDSGLSVGATLPEMVNSLRETLAENVPSQDQFEELLRGAGYLDTHAARYEQPHYALRKSQFFDVREGFPRLTERDLPAGVGDLVYTIMVGQCLQFAVTESEVNSLIARTA